MDVHDRRPPTRDRRGDAMCGISGYVRPVCGDPSVAMLQAMSRAQSHRGPDGDGYALFDSRAARSSHGREIPHDIGIAHVRFAIVDPSPAGRQPFWSHDVCVAFNGEIYNHVELRAELEKLGHVFRTRCDTEVLIEAYREWGTGCFDRFIGFWAIALYDARHRKLLLSRDRLGKAPLYVATHRNVLYFASEIPAIIAATGHVFPIREQAVADFVGHGWRDVHDQTFYEGVTTFPAASFAWVEPGGTLNPKAYWSLPSLRMSESQLPARDAIATFRRLLDDAVRIRLRADVPVGFELSGGLDSSCLVASAASRGHKLHAFNVSFPGTASDEEPFARAVAERYPGLVDYTVLQPPADGFWEESDEYVARMAEPFHAPNMLSNRGVWQQMAARGIKVSLNGAAGDESWAGYFNDYFTPFLRHAARGGDMPTLLRACRMFGDQPISVTSREFWRRVGSAFTGVQRRRGVSSPGSRSYVIDATENPLRLSTAAQRGPASNLPDLMRDLMGPWRMNYWLRSANQSYMSVPTEVRCPFLDHRLVELAFTVPVTYLLRDGWTKWLVRKAMADRLPPSVAWRKRKMGFPFPYSTWAAKSKTHYFNAMGRIDCPYVDRSKLAGSYDRLALENPLFLWRIMSLGLWWKRCVLGERLGAEERLLAA